MNTTNRLLRLCLIAGWLVAIAIVLAPQAAHAATCTAYGSGNWSSISWSGCTPGSGDDVIIFDNQTVTLDVDATVRGITIYSGATFNNGSRTLVAQGGYLTSYGTYNGKMCIRDRAYGIEWRQQGTSHVTFRHSNGSKLTVPAQRPIKPVYIRQFIRLVDQGIGD